jgi:hypothetical protein
MSVVDFSTGTGRFPHGSFMSLWHLDSGTACFVRQGGSSWTLVLVAQNGHPIRRHSVKSLDEARETADDWLIASMATGLSCRGAGLSLLRPSMCEESTCPIIRGEAEWTFARHEERLSLQHEPSADGVRLKVTVNHAPRLYGFSDLSCLTIFQHDMEALLVRTGWSLVDFSPERRRAANDNRLDPWPDERRRWWTDSARDR